MTDRGGSTRRASQPRRAPSKPRVTKKYTRVPKGQIDPNRKDPKMGRVIDMTGANDFTPAPSGSYTVEFKKVHEWARIKSGKNEGQEMAKVQYVITDEQAEDGTTVAGKVIFKNYPFTDSMRWVFLNDMKSLGFSDEELSGQVDWDEIFGQAVGRKAVAQVIVESYTYPEGHAKAGQTRFSNSISSLDAVEIPAMLRPGRARA